MDDLKILQQNVKQVESYLRNLFQGSVELTGIIEVLLQRWKEHLKKDLPSAVPLSLGELTNRVNRDSPDNVRVYASRARKMLRAAPELRASGYVFKVGIEERTFALKVTAKEDSVEPLRRFWQCHLPSPDEQPSEAVIIGVFARLFFNIKDELYVRAPSVNTLDDVVDGSLLDEVLSNHQRYTPTRQYVASGEVGAAFSLMEMFYMLGAAVKGARVFAEVQLNGIVLGSGIKEHNVIGPTFKYSVVPTGIIGDGAKGVTFSDDLRSSKQQFAHVLLNRWYHYERESFVTAIYSGISQAVEGVCYVLSHGKRVGPLLDAVKYDPSAKASQLVFRVGLRKTDTGRAFTSVSVWNGKAFVLFWPSHTD